eukprot:m.101188 g.101188  ORF g.101188 m.101188 type:complete len:54 (+) comp12571_c1_seq1:698-859(+)
MDSIPFPIEHPESAAALLLSVKACCTSTQTNNKGTKLKKQSFTIVLILQNMLE